MEKRRNLLVYIFVISLSFSINAQKTLSKLLKKYNTESVSYISVDSLMEENEFILLDAREMDEYNVSHLKNAIHVGYDKYDKDKTMLDLEDKNALIIVYCSLGIRSEDIAEQLQNEGYDNVFNLYGGIFEWKNKGYKVYDEDNKETEKVHTFNKEWSKWLKKGEKIYE